MTEDITALIGKTLTAIQRFEGELIFHVGPHEIYRMYHSQDCCESVTIDDIVGDLEDLIGSPILKADCATTTKMPAKTDYAESHLWTFYKFATIKGYVDIKWYGVSNGYYSERVDFERMH